MINNAESDGEAVDGDAPVSSRKDFARLESLIPERADVGMLIRFQGSSSTVT